ncbi:MAG: Leukotoxin [Verrucomicrobiota bacterium]
MAGAQVIQTWTQKSLAGDTSTAGESSAVVAMDGNYMFVADNEHETLRLFQRFPVSSCVDPLYSTNMRPWLNLTSTNPEDDIESAVMTSSGGTNRIYWLGSHSNSKSGGNLRPNRDRLFATQVNGNGSGSPAYSLAYVGRYDHLRTDLASWDRNNLHGLGSNYFGLVASTNSGVPSEANNGFNIEGLAMAPDGTNAWIAFRAPLVNGFGPTTNLAPRTHALIVPLKNLAALVAGSPTPGPGAAQFGAPIRLNLGGRGIRSLDVNAAGQYLITAGPTGDVSAPPVAPLNFRLFTWTGSTNDAPLERTTDFPTDYSPEGAVLPSGALDANAVVQFVSDDAVACWKSFTANVGTAILPPPFSLSLAAPSNGVAQLNLAAQTGLTYTVEYSATLTNWSWLRTVNSTGAVTPFTDSTATNELRLYRARY